jgi:signal transduction histidine kinase
MSKATVLIVEDDALFAEDLAGKLGGLGFGIAGITASGKEAVALTGRLRPDIVLMGIQLQGPMDGIEAAEAIRERNDVPVIYLSAHSDASTLARAEGCGPFGTIWKPFEALERLNETLEEKVAGRTALAETRARQLRTLAMELTEAEERERRRFAELLHEDLQQLMASARLQLQTASQGLHPEPLLNNVDQLLEQSIALSRRLSHELSPPVLHHSGLADALEWLGRQMSEQFGLQVRLEAEEASSLASSPLKVFLFRAVQELLFNAVKHAGVDRARVVVSRSEDNLVVTVSDGGRGFDPSFPETPAARSGSEGLGLLSLRERACYIGGNLEIDSAPGRGSRFLLTVPLRLAGVPEPQPEGPETEKRACVPEEGVAVAADNRGMRVMFVDDHKVMRQAGAEAFVSKSDSSAALLEAIGGP